MSRKGQVRAGCQGCQGRKGGKEGHA
jgi:hypothetical protein